MKISIIIPVYCVENYLTRCLDSVCNQSYTKLEIILVDDGSPDNCPAICDEWGRKDKRIKVIHKKNGGLSDARNAGIEVATGNYLLFIDSDDYIAPTMCERLLNAAQAADAEIAVCNFWWMYPEHKEIQSTKMPDGKIVERSAILETWIKNWTVDFVVAWNKLYRRDLFFTPEHIRYPVGKLHEDEFTTYKLLYAANRVVFVKDPLYFYVQRAGSITANYTEKNLNDFVAAVCEYVKWADSFAPKKRPLMEYLTVRCVLGIMRRCDKNTQLANRHDVCNYLRNFVDKEIMDFRHNPYASCKDYAEYILYKMGIYIPFMKLWKKLRSS